MRKLSSNNYNTVIVTHIVVWLLSMNFYAQYVMSDVMSSGPLKNCYLQSAIDK